MDWHPSLLKAGSDRHSKKPVLLNLTGPTAIGVTTLLRMLSRLYGPGFVGLECSEVCKEHTEMGTMIGKQLIQYQGTRNGEDYLDKLVFWALQEKIRWEMHGPAGTSIFCVGVAGGIRGLSQYRLWTEAGYHVFSFNIDGSLVEVFQGLELLKQGGVSSSYNNLATVIESYVEYQQTVVPMHEAIPESRSLRIKPGLTPVQRIEAVINFLNLPVGESIKRAFASPTHPVRVEAVKLEKEVSKPISLGKEVMTYLRHLKRLESSRWPTSSAYA